MLMNELSGFVVLAVLGGSLVALALYVLRASIRDLFRGCYYREGKIRCILNVRLAKMLTKKNIDIKRYLYDQPAADIMKHIRNCKHCRSVDQCDDYLNNKDMDVDTPFCLNNDSIVRIKKQQENPSF
jgi:hypothetical protein